MQMLANVQGKYLAHVHVYDLYSNMHLLRYMVYTVVSQGKRP